MTTNHKVVTLSRITAAVTMLEAAQCGEDTAGETQNAPEVSEDEGSPGDYKN